jgi:hypothetical protein
MQIRSTDFAILSRFADAVRAIPGIHDNSNVSATQALFVEMDKTVTELQGTGHSYDDAQRLCNGMVKIVQDVPTPAQLRRWDREDRLASLREIRWEAQANR